MAQKPPAFQFYAKDWRSSPQVRSMSLKEEGLYIRLCALAWDSDEPGTISLPERLICHEVGVLPATLRRFLVKFPTSFLREGDVKTSSSRREGESLVQPKLRQQWVNYQCLQQKRSASAKQVHHSASASAFASASASAINTKSTPASRPSPPVENVKSPKQRIAEHLDYRKEESDRITVASHQKRIAEMAEAVGAIPPLPRVLSQSEYEAKAQRQKREFEAHLQKAAKV